MLRAAQRWTDRISQFKVDGRRLGTGRVLELRYEELLAQPERELRRACEFLEIPFELEMMQLRSATENLGDARGHVGIKTDNTQKYKQRMDPQVRARIERIAAGALREYGYCVEGEGSTERLSATRLLVGQMRDGVNLVLADSRKRGLLSALRVRWTLFAESRAWIHRR
jgi:hypothetical protein